jgi:hypothetical protein
VASKNAAGRQDDKLKPADVAGFKILGSFVRPDTTSGLSQDDAKKPPVGFF